MAKKRILSFLLAMVMVFCLLDGIVPVRAAAVQEASLESGTADTGEFDISDYVGNYEIPFDPSMIGEDGSLNINLSSITDLVAPGEEPAQESDAADDLTGGEEEPAQPEDEEAPGQVSENGQTDMPGEGPEEPPEPGEETIGGQEGEEPGGADPSEEPTDPSEEPADPSEEPAEPGEELEEETEEETEELEETEDEESSLLSWHDFLAQAGGEGAIGQKGDYAAVRAQYEAYLAANGAGAAPASLSGAGLNAAVSASGQFTLGSLLYGHPYPWSSETLLTVDGTYSVFFDADEVVSEGGAVRAYMHLEEYGLVVCQTLSFAAPEEGPALLKVTYTVRNEGETSHSVAARLLLDICADGNDAAQLRVNGETIAEERVFTGSEVPESYEVLDTEDGVLAVGLLRADGASPVSVALCNWGAAFARKELRLSGSVLSDSAVCVGFAPLSLAPGGTGSVCTYYGPAAEEAPEDEDDAAEDWSDMDIPEPLTFFEWAQEQGLEAASLSKEGLSAAVDRYGVYRVNFLAEYLEMPDGASAAGSIANKNIEVAMSSEGKYTIGTRIGNPNYTSDDYQILLYGHPNPGTSETLIVIDGAYSNFFTADSTSYSSSTATATMTIPAYKIKVVQTLKLVKSASTGFEDTVQIQYQVINNDSKKHSVGVRIMLDTMLANNDDAPFKITGVGEVTTARVFTGASVPSTYQVYDNLRSPTTLATGYLYKSGDTKPDKVQFCNWSGINGSGWNHSVSNGDYLGDSAVGIYFNPKEVKAGKSFTVRTYYGVSVGTGAGSGTVVSGGAQITIKDSDTKAPIQGATISYTANGVTKAVNTDSSGVATLSGLTAASQSVSLKITKAGYKESTRTEALSKSSKATYYLSSESSKRPVIQSIILTDGSDTVDLLTGTAHYVENKNKELKAGTATGSVTITATSSMKNCTYYLMQNEKVVQKNSTGKFTFQTLSKSEGTIIESLTAEGNRYIKCVSADGVSSEKYRFGLKVAMPKINGGFGEKLSLGELWPAGSSRLAEGTLAFLFLGDKFNFGVGKDNSPLKIFFEITSDAKVRLGLNVSKTLWDKHREDWYSKTGSHYRESLEYELEDLMERYVKGDKSVRNALGQFNRFGSGSFSFDVIFSGYGEGKMENGKCRIDLKVMIAASAKASYTTYFIIVAVPAYIQVGAKLEGAFKGSANVLNSEGFQFAPYEFRFNPSFALWLEGGVGIKSALSVGAKGEAKIQYLHDFVTKYSRADLTGSATLVAEAFIWEKEVPLGEKTIVLYDSNDQVGTIYGGDENIYELIENTPFRLKPRTARHEESADGGTTNRMTAPKLLTVNGTQYLFSIVDRGGNLVNRNMLVFSRWEDGDWTSPLAVSDDGTSDNYFDVATDGSRIYVVWGNTNRTFDDSCALDTFAAAQEIAFAEIDPATDTVSRVRSLTADGVMDTMPAVTAVDGTAYAVWFRTANGFEENVDTYDNYICYTSVSGDEVGATQTLNCGSGAINSISATNSGGVPSATYALNTANEYNIYAETLCQISLSSGTVSQKESGENVLGRVVVGTVNGQEKLFWMENGNVLYADSLDAADPQCVFPEDQLPGGIGADNYTVITVGGSTYLIWTNSGQDETAPAVAMTAIYSGGRWGEAHKLTELQSGIIRTLDGYQAADGSLVLVYTVENYTDDGEGGVDVSSATLEKTVMPEKTIAMGRLEYSLSDAGPGQTMPIRFQVTNTGNTLIDDLEVAIFSDNGDSYQHTFSGVNIGPGAWAEVSVEDFVLGAELETLTGYDDPYVYTVLVNAAGSEFTASESFETGFDLLSVYKDDLVLIENEEYVAIVVANNSGFAAKNVHLRVLADSTDGALVCDEIIEEIPGNDNIRVYINLEDLASESLFASVTSDSTAWDEEELFQEIVISVPITAGTLTVRAIGGGSVTPDEPADLLLGDEIVLRAEPEEGYSFDRWSAGCELTFTEGDETSPEAVFCLTEGGDILLDAIFLNDMPHDFVLAEESLRLYAGQEYELKAEFASDREISRVTWTSADESIAAVSDRGLVTAAGEGSTVITAVCGEYEHSCTVTVEYVDVTEIRMIYPQIVLSGIGATAQAEVVTDPPEGEGSLLWSSDNPDVVTVDGHGRVTAEAFGEATVTAVSRKDGSVSVSCAVSVILPVEDIQLDVTSLTLDMNDENANSAEIHVIFVPEEASLGKTVAWSVDDPDVVEIVAGGTNNDTLSVRGKAPGYTVIYARTEDGIAAFCEVTVRNTVYVDSIAQLQSEHPYAPGTNRTWSYTDPEHPAMRLLFDERCSTAEGDSIIVMDGNGEVAFQGPGYELSGCEVAVMDSTVQIQLISTADSAGEDPDVRFGFAVEDVAYTFSLDDCTIDVEDVSFTGNAVEPWVYVFSGDTELERGKDYSLRFSNNKAVGYGTVTVTGLGYFEGSSRTETFRIIPGYSELSVNVVAKGIKLSWNASKGAGGYEIYRSEDGGYYSLYKTITSGSTKSFTDTGVDKNGAHFYRYYLIPFKNVKVGGYTERFAGYTSETDWIAKIGPVTGLTVKTDPALKTVTLNWKEVPGADGYRILRSEGDSLFYVEDALDGSGVTTWTDPAPSEGRNRYKVVPCKRIYGDLIDGGASGVVTAYRIGDPYDLTVYNAWKSVELFCNWRSYDGSTGNGIEVYRSANGGAFKKIKTIKSDGRNYTSFTDTSAKTSGTYYEYKVRTFAVDGGKTYYSDYSEPVGTLFLSSPTISGIQRTDAGFEITWGRVAGAENYALYRYGPSEREFTRITELTPANPEEKTFRCTDAHVDGAGYYYYYISAEAVRDGAQYDNSGQTKTACWLEKAILTEVRNSAKGLTLFWEPVEYAAAYEVYRSPDGVSWAKVKTVSACSFNDTKASKNGMLYYYRVRAVRTIAKLTFGGEYSDVLSCVKMTPPTVKSVQKTDTGFRIDFSRVADAEYYTVTRIDTQTGAEESVARIEQSAAKVNIVTDEWVLEENVVYRYRVTACRDGNGVPVLAYSEFAVCAGAAPVLQVQNLTGGMELSAPAPNALVSGYTIYRSVDGGAWKKLKTVKAPSGALLYTDTSVKPGKTYLYYVQATASGAKYYVSPASDPAGCIRITGTTLAVSNATTGMRLAWKPVADAVEYNVYFRDDDGSFRKLDTVSPEVLSYLAEPAMEDEELYEFRIGVVREIGGERLECLSAAVGCLRLFSPEIEYVERYNGKTAFVYWEELSQFYKSGYQIRYSTGRTSKTVKATDFYFGKLTKLDPGETYEICVRSFVKIGKVTYYSDWSAPYYA